MRFKVKFYNVDSSEPRIVMHDDDCVELGVKEMDRVRIDGKSKSTVTLVSRTDTVVKKGTVLMSSDVMKKIEAKDGDEVNIENSPKPESVKSIRHKMDNERLSTAEINEVVKDIAESKLSKIEISAWLTALYINGMDVEEIADFTNAMVDTGDRMVFDRQPVFDFHSLGESRGTRLLP